MTLVNEPINQERRRKKFCWFKKTGIKYIDYKDPIFLLKFVNENGRVLPRRITGTSLKYQRKLSTSIKRARQLALMPYDGDSLN
jgi:small subunit ribosomal protein S18